MILFQLFALLNLFELSDYTNIKNAKSASLNGIHRSRRRDEQQPKQRTSTLQQHSKGWFEVLTVESPTTCY
ncbi:hypothetical protein ScPMuIL_017379 [Solemya velum]